MKKVISLVLAIALLATLSVVAFAETHCEEYCHVHTFKETPDPASAPIAPYVEKVNGNDTVVGWVYDPDYVKAVCNESSDHVDITDNDSGIKMTMPAHKDAVTQADLDAVKGNHKDLVVFYQRDVDKAGSFNVKLWDCQPAKGQNVVVLVKGSNGVWTLLVDVNADTVSVTLPVGTISFAVCRSYK